jgi:FkbM family methyltransferase
MNVADMVNKIFSTLPVPRENYIDLVRGKKCFLYGAGSTGLALCSDLVDDGINIAGFIDDLQCTSQLDVPVYSPNDKALKDVTGENACVIITFGLPSIIQKNEVYKRCHSLGFNHVYYYLPFLKNFYDQNAIAINKDSILKTVDLLNDDESRIVFLSNLIPAITRDIADYSLPTSEQTYLPSLPFSKGLERVIDCGAYVGDTGLLLNKLSNGTLRELALFEADINNFTLLCTNTSEQLADVRCFLFPCGVYNRNTSMHFKTAGAGGAISTSGDSIVQLVKIDDALKEFAPTYIKMDIEGAEYAATEGARETIRKYSPDLAISVYHNLRDLWELPLLIKSINPSYSFYLRNHYMYGLESVLYCTTERM